MTTLKHESFALTSIGPGQPCREVLYPALLSVAESLKEHPNSPTAADQNSTMVKSTKASLESVLSQHFDWNMCCWATRKLAGGFKCLCSSLFGEDSHFD